MSTNTELTDYMNFQVLISDEEKLGSRINVKRVQMAVETKAPTLLSN